MHPGLILGAKTPAPQRVRTHTPLQSWGLHGRTGSALGRGREHVRCARSAQGRAPPPRSFQRAHQWLHPSSPVTPSPPQGHLGSQSSRWGARPRYSGVHTPPLEALARAARWGLGVYAAPPPTQAQRERPRVSTPNQAAWVGGIFFFHSEFCKILFGFISWPSPR